MSKKNKEKKGFFGEFKEFITRGNVLDMAVGVIVGGAFTAIVNALSNQILKPIINWILAVIVGADSLDHVFTFLKTAYDPVTGAVDLAASIYIDWGAFINAIINFLLIALVLFCIVKLINKLNAVQKDLKEAAVAAAEKREQERLAEEAKKQAELTATTTEGSLAEKPAETVAPAEEKKAEEKKEN